MLQPQQNNLLMREDPQHGVFVEGQCERTVHSLDEALDEVNHALSNRVMASTLMV